MSARPTLSPTLSLSPLSPLATAALVLAVLLAAGLPGHAAAETPAGRVTVAAASPAATQSAPPAPVAMPAPAPADPLVDLRQRLVERLAVGQPAAGGALELRLSPRPAGTGGAPSVNPSAATSSASSSSSTSSSATPSRAAATRAAAAAPARNATGASPGPALPWSYDGSTGPTAWGTLKPEYALCAQGQRQSPIDLQGGLPVDLEPVRFDYRPSRFGVVDTGRTLQVNVAGGNHIELGGRKFELKRAQFHHPAEHRIDGRRFALSAHLVHEDAEGRQVVVAVLLDPGPAQPVLQTLWSHIPLEKHQEQAARVGVDFSALLPSDGRYYTYMGSTTAPPCREGVQWVVMRTPMTLAPEQLELFARIYPMNARPVQAAAGRRILQSN